MNKVVAKATPEQAMALSKKDDIWRIRRIAQDMAKLADEMQDKYDQTMAEIIKANNLDPGKKYRVDVITLDIIEVDAS